MDSPGTRVGLKSTNRTRTTCAEASNPRSASNRKKSRTNVSLCHYSAIVKQLSKNESMMLLGLWPSVEEVCSARVQTQNKHSSA